MYQFSPSLIKPPRWNIKPHLTAAPELWRGDTEVVPFWSGETPVMLTAGGFRQPRSINGSPTSDVGIYGPEGSTRRADNEQWNFDSQVISKRVNYAYTALIATPSPNADHGISASSQSLSRRVFRLSWNGSGRSFDFRIWDGSARSVSGNTTFGTNEFHIGTVVHDSDGLRMYVDGVNEGNTSANLAQTGDNGVIALGNAEPNGNQRSDLNWVLFIAHDYAPTAFEVENLHADPFAMLRPGPQLLPLLFGGAGATGSTVSGEADQYLSNMVQDAAGTLSFEAGAAQTLVSVTQQASGDVLVPVSGAAAQTLPMVAQDASGTLGNDRTGTIAQTLPMAAQDAQGAFTYSGVANQNVPALRQVAAGNVIAPTAAQTLPAITQSAAGELQADGQIDQTLPTIYGAVPRASGRRRFFVTPGELMTP